MYQLKGPGALQVQYLSPWVQPLALRPPLLPLLLLLLLVLALLLFLPQLLRDNPKEVWRRGGQLWDEH